MTKQHGWLFCLASVLLSLLTVCPVSAKEPLLNGLAFGDPPAPDMVCIRGACEGSRMAAKTGTKRISTYKRVVDQTLLGRTEITAPKYDFFDGRLFRVRASLMCPKDLELVCVTEVTDILDDSYFLDPVPHAPRSRSTHLYNASEGMRVAITWALMRNGWEGPLVSLYHRERMDQIRQTFNPRYSQP